MLDLAHICICPHDICWDLVLSSSISNSLQDVVFRESRPPPEHVSFSHMQRIRFRQCLLANARKGTEQYTASTNIFVRKVDFREVLLCKGNSFHAEMRRGSINSSGSTQVLTMNGTCSSWECRRCDNACCVTLPHLMMLETRDFSCKATTSHPVSTCRSKVV